MVFLTLVFTTFYTSKKAGILDNSNVSFNLYQRKPYQLAFAGAETNNGECNTQIMEFNFKGGDISMFQFPNTYDFTYRKDFENLQKIKTKAQAEKNYT